MIKSNSKLWKIRTLAALGCILGMLALCACGGVEDEGREPGAPGPAPTGEAIKIGALFAITGPASPLGTPERDTALMLADKLNEAGGINGRKVELIIYDTEAKEDKAIGLVKRLIERDQVTAIIGGSTSGVTLAMMPTIIEAEIPYISCAASVKIVEPVNPWVFKTPQSDRHAVEKIFEHIKKTRPGVTKLGMIHDENPFGTSGLHELRDLAPRHGFELVSVKSFNNEHDTARTLSPSLIEMMQDGAEVIICWGTNPGPAHVTAAWADTGLKAQDIPLYQSHGVANRRFIEFAENISSNSTEGVFLPAGKLIVADELSNTDPQKSLLLEYGREFRARYGRDADTFGGHAWDAFNLMVNAIETAGTDRKKIRDAIENTRNFVGIGGVFNFSPTDHNGLDLTAFAMVTVQNGDWTIAE